MKKKFTLAFLFVSFIIVKGNAQDNEHNYKSGLAVLMGGKANYYYGLPDRNFDQFETSRLNWQLDGMIGVTVARSKGGQRTMLAAFGDLGFNNSSTIKSLLADQQYTTTATKQGGANNFYQLEGGVLIAEVIRLSTGIGQQNFNVQTISSPDGNTMVNVKSLKYRSSTVGLHLNVGAVAWIVSCNFAYGKDFNKTVITPSAGLMFRF